ncbi:MAG: VCBS repeat-containing protein [Deltaproteobacteria bacterium]|nr:VCBS repeat-containing protein [Deltaproteobacteria bacterium]
MKHNNIRVLSVIIITLLFVFVKAPVSIADDPKKVAILPFNMNADRDLTFLQEGIMDMIRVRLSWKGKVELLEKGVVKREAGRFKGSLDKDKGLTIGKALGADYVILGSLTVFGESVSIDASILDVKKSEELFTAYNQSKGMNEVIPTVNQFAQDINAKIMGRYIRPPAYATGPGFEGGPEYKRGPGGLISVGGDAQEQKFDHVQTIDVDIRCIDSGDVDGDGKNELVVMDKDTVYIYRWAEKGFVLFKSFKGRWSPDYIYFSMADMDGNGRDEIYLNSQSRNDVISSVLEYRSGSLAPVADGGRQFIRVLDLPGRGNTLIGQKRSPTGFARSVYVLKREGNSLARVEKLNLPPMADIFNFVQGHITDRNSVQTLVLHSETEYFFLFDAEGEEVWRSEEEFGGSLLFMESMPMGHNTDDPDMIYFSPPLFMSDLDNDGSNEVVVCKNASAVGRILGRAKFYTSGKVHLLSWDGSDLATKWETKKLSGGPVTGYFIKDVDNDGRPELVISSLKRSGIIIRSEKSQLFVMNLD